MGRGEGAGGGKKKVIFEQYSGCVFGIENSHSKRNIIYK